jgi:ABC-type Fe3+-hydroxamate transport system substrate-binding protein
VDVPKNVSKIACISASMADFMISFGLGDKIVGVYSFMLLNDWVYEIYPEAHNYKSYDYEVSAEELLSDGVDLVISLDPRSSDNWKDAGIPTILVSTYSETGPYVEEAYQMVDIIATIFPEVKDKAEAWKKDYDDAISEIQTAIGTEDSDTSVYYVNGAKSKGLYYSDGKNTIFSRMCDIANVKFATEKYKATEVHSVSEEELVSLNPDAMIIGGVYQNYLLDLLDNSELWSSLNCYKENKVYTIPVAFVNLEILSCETPVMMKYLAGLFNDGYEYDLSEGLKQCMKKYFNYTLTDSDVYNMCHGLNKSGVAKTKQ